MKWDFAVRIGRYFGIFSEKEAKRWVGDESVAFYLEVDGDGNLFATPGDSEDDLEDDFLEEDKATLA